MEKIGYKAFYKGLIDMYGNKRELNCVYKIDGPIAWYSSYGRTGYHFCTHLEDCFSYFNGFDNDIDLTIVKSSGCMIQFDDCYRGNFEMYASDNIEILKILTRKEVIDYFLKRKKIPWVMQKFIYGYPLTNEEQLLFMDDEVARKTINKVYCKKNIHETMKN